MLITFQITDGTVTVDFLAKNSGFHLKEATANAPDYKSLTWNNPALINGRRPSFHRYANITDVYTFDLNGFTQDQIIASTQKLRALFTEALEYWDSDWTTKPVWIVAQAACETNKRYATILMGNYPKDPNPFTEPFTPVNDLIAQGDVPISIEHSIWQDAPPGQTTCVMVSSQQSYYKQDRDIGEPWRSEDDCDAIFGAMFLMAGVNIRLGKVAGDSYDAGVLYRNMEIPPGATILTALAYFEADQNDANDNCNVLVDGELNANPAMFSTGIDFYARTHTVANVGWNAIPHWTAGTLYYCGSLAPVIQEIINLPGWASGNNIVLFFFDNISTVNAVRRPIAWDHALPRREPYLYVLWYTTTALLGRGATCDNENFIANKHNKANITHVFHNRGAAWSANLMAEPLPVTFLPAAPPAINDAVYFGCSSAVANSGPFCSVIFDIGTAATLAQGNWEYWNGAAWVGIPEFVDKTDLAGVVFGLTGVHGLFFPQPSDWATRAINGVTAWWIRNIITVGGGISPTQKTRVFYSVVTPTLNVNTYEVTGDLPALAEIKLYACLDHIGYSTLGQSNHFIVGLRSILRGVNFSAYLNAADEQHMTGITCVLPTMGAFIADMLAPTGRSVVYPSPAGASLMDDEIVWELDSAQVHEYKGSYRAFIRYRSTAGALTGDFRVQLKSYFISDAPGGLVIRTALSAGPIITLPMPATTDHFAIEDLGVITFNVPTLPAETMMGSGQFGFCLRMECNDAAEQMYVYDVIIMPRDECILDLGNPLISGRHLNEECMLDVDGIKLPKLPYPVRAPFHEAMPGVYYGISYFYPVTTVGDFILQCNALQRLWFLGYDAYARTSGLNYCMSGQLFKLQRYFTQRGAK